MPDPAVMKGVLRHLRRTERRRLYDLLGNGELLARFLADRDEAAFEELVCRHGPMVRAVCRRVLGPTADADDAFQAAFLVLLRKARFIRRTDLLANWLCAVAYRTARQALRRRFRLGARERAWDDLPEPCRPDDPPRDWLPLFDAALQQLPSKYREPVVLCELQGLARPEAARRLGLNEGTLSSRLGRARDLLRRRLSPYGFPLAVGTALGPAVVPEALTASTAAAAVSVSAASVPAIVLTEGVLAAMFASKLKAGAACSAVLLAGVVAGFHYSGAATMAGGPAKDSAPTKDVAKEAAKPEPTGGPDSRAARLPAEYEPFQGEWVVASTQINGATGAANTVGVDERWKFTGDSLTTGDDLKEDAPEKFSINARAKPPTIDFILTRFSPDGTGTLLNESYQGIYRVEADGGLTICYRRKAERVVRPTRFATAHNSGAMIVHLRRPAPAAPAVLDPGTVPAGPTGNLSLPSVPANASGPAITDALPPPGNPIIPVVTAPAPGLPTAADFSLPLPATAPTITTPPPDLDRLQGGWTPIQLDGKAVGAGEAEAGIIEILKDRLLFSDGKHGRLRIDESKGPRRIAFELHGQGKESLSGIYKLEGDRLTIASHTRSGKLVPAGFEPDAEAGIGVVVYERVKGDRPPARTIVPDGGSVDLPPASRPALNSSRPPEVSPAVAADAVMAINTPAFRLPYTLADPKAAPVLHLFRSDDRGRTWAEVAEAKAKTAFGHFDVTVPKPGTYWFALQTQGPDGKRSPADHAGLTPVVKVRVELEDRPTGRDVQKEVDQLREQLKRLEKELKDGPKLERYDPGTRD